MCTIVVLYKACKEFPLIIAANRDEFYARRSSGPKILIETPRIVGGVDQEKGGTWMGVTQTGIFVGITNQRTDSLPSTAPKSRGKVVMHALEAETVEGIISYLKSLNPLDYNPFNLLFGNTEALWIAYSRHNRETIVLEPVPTGVHVLPNDRLNSQNFSKVKRAQMLVPPLLEASWSTVRNGLETMLSSHTLPSYRSVPNTSSIFPRVLAWKLEAFCIHLPRYGTRSSTILALTPGKVAQYLFAEDAPCRSSFRDMSFLLQ